MSELISSCLSLRVLDYRGTPWPLMYERFLYHQTSFLKLEPKEPRTLQTRRLLSVSRQPRNSDAQRSQERKHQDAHCNIIVAKWVEGDNQRQQQENGSMVLFGSSDDLQQCEPNSGTRQNRSNSLGEHTIWNQGMDLKKTKNLEIKKMGQDRRPRDCKYNYNVLSSKVESSQKVQLL